MKIFPVAFVTGDVLSNIYIGGNEYEKNNNSIMDKYSFDEF